MRGTNKITELVDINVSAIALVGKPALGKPYAIIKSEDAEDQAVIKSKDELMIIDQKSLDMVRLLMKEELEVFKASMPLPSSDKPFVDTPPDPQREVMLKSLKDLVANSSELLKEQREQLAVVAKYHGLEGPAVSDEEEPNVSPAMQAMMQKMESVVTAINGLVAQISNNQTPPKPQPTVQKDSDVEPPVDQAALEKALETQCSLKKELEMLQWTFLKATGKDPGPKPE